jgi:tetratricopeptide (TPR) repeat protein
MQARFFVAESEVCSEQMYKKRLHAWELSKYMKASEKNEAISDILRGTLGPLSDQSSSSRSDKIMRHARSRVKDGTLDKQKLDGLKSRRKRQLACDRNLAIASTGPTFTTNQSPRAITPHALTCADFTLPVFLKDHYHLLHSLGRLMLSDDTKFTPTRSRMSLALRDKVERGMDHWELHAFSSARECFCKAAEVAMESLQQRNSPDLMILRYLTPGWDLRRCEPFYHGFATFIAKAVSQNIGLNHPFVDLATIIQRHSTDWYVQEAIWDYVLDDLKLSRDNFEEWTVGALTRIRVCNNFGMLSLAMQHNKDATELLEGKGILNYSPKIMLLYELGKALQRDNQYDEALATLAQVVSLTTTDPCARSAPSYNHYAHRRLAIIYEEVRHNLYQAHSHLTEAFLHCWAHTDRESMAPFSALKHLWEFCQRNHLDLRATIPVEDYRGAYQHLETISEGMWRVQIEDSREGSGDGIRSLQA